MERTYNIPLRKEFRKAPKYKRTTKAVKALRKFISKHMKSDEIKIGRNLNQHMWKDGIKNPPHHVKVTLVKDEEGVVKAELFGHKYVELTKEEMEKQLEDQEKAAKKAKKEKTKPKTTEALSKEEKTAKEPVKSTLENEKTEVSKETSKKESTPTKPKSVEKTAKPVVKKSVTKTKKD